jgi:predicted ATPase
MSLNDGEATQNPSYPGILNGAPLGVGPPLRSPNRSPGMRRLENVIIKGFKSIENQSLELSKLNVFIGGNGSGKSNLIQAFRFLREIARGNLATYSLERGADSLLFFGRKRSPEMQFHVRFGEPSSSNAYEITLRPTDENSLVVAQEVVYFQDRNRFSQPLDRIINTGSREPVVGTSKDRIARYVRHDLESYVVYHFHDTSDSAAVKHPGSIDDNRMLRPDAANLAAYLFSLQEAQPDSFRNIEDAVRQIAPFFDRFVLQPLKLAPDKIRLEWLERGSDSYFNAMALSDGTLRFMCLATLLLQPQLPALVLLDEPELGLHPAAIALLADLLRYAAERSQVIVSTQSVTLVNQFSAEDVWTVDRKDGATCFEHLAHRNLQTWLDEYDGSAGFALGELWEKNVIGGRP